MVFFISLMSAMPLNIYAADLEPGAAGLERTGGAGESGDGEGTEENIGNGFLDAMLDTVFGMDG